MSTIILGGGSWGFFDDEGDLVADYAGDIERKVLPSRLQFESCSNVEKRITVPRREANKKVTEIRDSIGPNKQIYVFTSSKRKTSDIHYETDESIRCYKERIEYIVSHPDKVLAVIKKTISQYNNDDHVIAGIALYLARGWGSTPIMFKHIDAKNPTRGWESPKLPKWFPNELREMAHQASIREYVGFDNSSGWTNPEVRLNALEEQIKLFAPKTAKNPLYGLVRPKNYESRCKSVVEGMRKRYPTRLSKKKRDSKREKKRDSKRRSKSKKERKSRR